jgi:glycerol kinase
MGAYLALDQGTTSSRAVVFDEDGDVLGQARHEFTQHFPAPGQVEHDAEEIWDTQRRAAHEAHQAAGQPRLEGVGVTNQRETVVLFDRATGKPLHRAIVWQDRRTAAALEKLKAQGAQARVTASTGLPLDPYFSAMKIGWLLDSVPGARAAAVQGKLGAATIDAWLLHRLTGGKVFATEPSNASRTSLFDLQRGEWSEELCELFGVPRACLPEVRPSGGDFGRVEGTGWPIRGVLGDQQAALFGQGAFDAGEGKCTYGTGAFLLVNAGLAMPRPEHGLLATIGWRLGEQTTFALEGSVFVSGALVQWLRDGLGILESAAEIEPLARSVADSGGVALVPALAGLGAPHWDPQARGLIAGISRGTTRAHIARAALEAMALQVGEVLDAMRAASGLPIRRLRVDGGACRNDLLLELQAGLSQVEVVRPDFLETTALGAFRIAQASRLGLRDGRGLPPLARRERTFLPQEVPQREALIRRWREAVRRSLGFAAF